MTAKDFVEAFEAAAAKILAFGSASPTGLVDNLEWFVGMVEAGYDDNIYEFNNDLSVRGTLEALIADPSVRAHPESGWVVEAVEKLDERLRAVMSDGPVREYGSGAWWCTHLPIVAGPEFAQDLYENYGYRVPRIV